MAAILPASTGAHATGHGRLVVTAVATCTVLALAGLWMPRWLSFLLTMAAANGLVSLGIVGLMRGGVVPFGQGMMLAAGGYAAALVYNHLGFTDALGMALIGGVSAALIAAPFAPLLSRYRGIFFAMLTLALSMVTYGLLMKLDVLGGSDGFNVGRPTLFGQQLPDGRVVYTLYVLAMVLATVMALLARIFFDSTRGLVTLAVKENELRVEYLGGSVRQSMTINFILAAFCGGIGGALAVMALGHIEPNFGGSDGFNVGRPTLFGQQLPDGRVVYTLYVLAMVLATVMALLARIFFDSTRGLVTLAVKENELRVEYLGGSVRQAMTINFILAAFCGGIGGALAVMALGHIEPNFSFWTTSGEFVFVAILAGWQSVAAVFIASTVLEVVRSFSSTYFPNTWQLVLGIFLLLVIRFLPGGIGSLWMGRKRR